MSHVTYEWVMARYSGEQAKHVMALAAQGIGYMVLEQPDKGSGWVVAAFRRAKGAPEIHLQLITKESLIRKLEDKFIPKGNA